LSSTNALAFGRLAQKRIALKQNKPKGVWESADWLSRYATNLAPDDPEVGQIRRAVVEKLGGNPGSTKP
jgi:hypothetical protein